MNAATPARKGLEVEELSHRFGDRLVVDHVSLMIAPGEVHCLVGPSVCGKTTILRLTAGLENLRSGRISLNGRLLAGPDMLLPPERRRVGLMFQDFALFPHLRVVDNIAFGLDGTDRRSRHQGEQSGAAAGPERERGVNHRETGLHRESLRTCSM